MKLSRSAIHKLSPGKNVPPAYVFNLPEKVLQFGTGVLLRGLIDPFIDNANRQNIFNGRVMMVKSTAAGDINLFAEQDNLYTVCTRGIENGIAVAANTINASVSRVVNAETQWKEVLAVAASPELVLIVSNTTEVGLQLNEENILNQPPQSFPAKLLAVLYHRYLAFKGSKEKGVVVVPTELVPRNADILFSILVRLSTFNKLDTGFTDWLIHANQFCNSLVDRIVPGTPAPTIHAGIENEIGYTDKLLIVAEPYKLWAIEGNQYVKEKLTFCNADSDVVIADDISQYRELKLRMLNGTHTLCCGLAFLRGFQFVSVAMNDKQFRQHVESLMLDEIAAGIPLKIDIEIVAGYGKAVLDRFTNPHIQHKWLGITVQYTSKMIARVLPVLTTYLERNKKVPEKIAEGFAAWLCFMRPVMKNEGNFSGEWKGVSYPLNDDYAAWFFDNTRELSPAVYVETALKKIMSGNYDTNKLTGFSQKVLYYYLRLIEQ